MPTPEEWLATFNTKIAEVKAKTEAFQRDLDQAGATETSKDGTLSVTVAPNGSISNLRIDDTAVRGSGAELANKIMQLARKAQRAAAVNVAEAFAPLGSPDSEALHMITGYLPEPEEDDEEPDGPSYSFDEQPATPPAPEARPQPGPPPADPQRRRSTRRDDDDDFSNDDLFGR
jgi:DNA-binding protein YbaB